MKLLHCLAGLFLVASIGLCSVGNLLAQSRPRMIFGGGVNVSNFWYPDGPGYTNPSIERSSITGIMVFGSVEFQLYHNLFVAPELAYIQKGAHFDNLYGDRGSIEYNIDYLQLSSKFTLKLGPDWVRFCFFASPGVAITTASNVTQDVMMPGGALLAETFDYYGKTVFVEFNGDLGAGIEIMSVQGTSISLNAAYSFGLTNWSVGGNAYSKGLHLFADVGFEI